MSNPHFDLDDVQGLLASGYAKQKHAVFLVLKVTDAVRGRRWLQQIVPQVTKARKPATEVLPTHSSLNIAITFQGFRALGVSQEALATFPTEFQLGMQERKQILGDTGLSDPAQWDEFFRDEKAIHVLLLLYAASDETLASLVATHSAHLREHGIDCLATLPTHVRTKNHEHFGFKDGISQPSIQGLTHAEGQDVLEPGEFILGYADHANELPASPTVPAQQDAANHLPESRQLGNSGVKDLGANGSYLVFRKLYQDVGFFNRSLDTLAAQIPAAMVPAKFSARDWLAAKVVGRFPNGSPLALSDQSDANASAPNSFNYSQTDPEGLNCPFGSHVRRANPRDVLPSAGTQSRKIVNNHRLVRRGRSYGSPYDKGKEKEDRGLYFIALCANICRQFEFVQQTWINSPKFGGLFDNVDCLSGNNPDPKHWEQLPGTAPLTAIVPPDEPTNNMTIPAATTRVRVCGFERFVRVKGGAYFFLPSIRALQFVSHL